VEGEVDQEAVVGCRMVEPWGQHFCDGGDFFRNALVKKRK